MRGSIPSDSSDKPHKNHQWKCKKIHQRDKILKKRMRNINQYLKELEKKMEPKKPNDLELSLLEILDEKKESEDELIDLLDAEWRVRQTTPDGITTQKETPNQTSDTETRTKHRSGGIRNL